MRFVYFAAGDRPVQINAGSAEAALAAVERELDPPEDFNASAEMRMHLAKVLARQALQELAQ